jgi:hypothetical protein
VGCNTHGGTPPLEDETGEDYPNHGWFNGVMDDVRIYGRALSGSEVAALAGVEWSEPEEPSTPAQRIIRAGTLRVGTIQGP